MSGLRILAAGPGTTVQDLGRIGQRRFGIPWAGAMDRGALALANALVGNPADAAGIEFIGMGGRLRVEGAPLLLAATGPGVTLHLDGAPCPEGRALRAPDGAVIDIGAPRGGVFAYLAIAGGVQSAPEMGSRSAHVRSGIGGGVLAAGTALPCTPAPDGAILREAPAHLLAPCDPAPIRVVPGPQQDHFTDAAVTDFLASTYRVSPRSDRMGRRLEGPRLAHRDGYNIVSDGVLPGNIQVPGDGQPIVLMRDAQTTGGYPKIATVISADLDRMAQLPPGAPLRFAAVTQDEAVALARAEATRLAALPGQLRTADTRSLSERLMGENLIDGLVDMRDWH